MRYWLIGLLSCWFAVGHAASSPCEALIEQSNAQLEAMREHAEAIEGSLKTLSDALLRAEQRNSEQTQQIERLEAELRAQRARDPSLQERQQRDFFRALRRQLPVSGLYDVLPDRLIIANDPVFIFGKGELGAEGQDRLKPLVTALKDVVEQLPEAYPWRLRIEGHTDSRPLRTNQRFESNWELSAARAVSLLKYLVANGLPEDRLTAVGLADNQMRDPGTSTAAHRRNRRIEVHLIYLADPAS